MFGYPRNADNAQFGLRGFGKTADNLLAPPGPVPRGAPAPDPRTLSAVFGRVGAPKSALFAFGVPPNCVHSGQRDAEPQTTLVVCGFFGLPKAATANNIQSG